MEWYSYKKMVLGDVWECSGENYIKKDFIYILNLTINPNVYVVALQEGVS